MPIRNLQADYYDTWFSCDNSVLGLTREALRAPIKHADMVDPDQAERDMLPEADKVLPDREADDSKRHKGFPLSAEMRAEVASESSFHRMQRVMRQANKDGVQLYNKAYQPILCYWTATEDDVKDSELIELGEEVQEHCNILVHRFFTMQEHLRVLAHKGGSAAGDARDVLQKVYRDDWARMVHLKYGEQTESQRERRVVGGQVQSWSEQTVILNTTDKEPSIRMQLDVPELRWLRANQVQREAALAQVRWCVHNLFWCASEARKANTGAAWGHVGPIRISAECQQHWDDAIEVMHLYLRMLTRFVDANERQLVLKAVMWEVYWNDHHKPIGDYLGYVATTTEDDCKLVEFLHAFNQAEMRGIHDKIDHAWHKARVFFLGCGAIRGYDGDLKSNNAVETFTAWLRRRAVRCKVRADVDLMGFPEEDRDMFAQDLYGVDSYTDLTKEQKAKLAADWRKGQEDSAMLKVDADPEERRRKAELELAAHNNAQRRAQMAFPSPDVLDSMVMNEYAQSAEGKQKAAEKTKREMLKAAKAAAEAKSKRKQPMGPLTNTPPAKTHRVATTDDSTDKLADEVFGPDSDDDDVPPSRTKTYKTIMSDDEEDEEA